MMLTRWWLQPAPAARLALARILVGIAAVIALALRFEDWTRPNSSDAVHFVPVGIARLLSAPLPPAWSLGIGITAIVLGLAFTFGIAFRFLAPLFAATLLFTFSYQSSWGVIFHTENVLVLHVLLLSLSPAADSLSLTGRGSRHHRECSLIEGRRYGWPLRAMSVVLVTTYFIAGVAKLRLTGASWANGEVLHLQVWQMVGRNTATGVSPGLFSDALLAHPKLFAPLSMLTLACELGAPAALLHARLAKLWCLSLWLFHLAVFLTMGIAFPYPLSGVAFASFFPLEKLLPSRRLGKRPAGPFPAAYG